MSILLVGCGKMGGAMLAGWRARGLGPFTVVEPKPGDIAAPDITLHAAADQIAKGFAPRAIVFAVKPQMMDAVVPAYRRFKTLFVSIAAGKTHAYFQDKLGPVAMVRAMPNTPAAIGRGITVAHANAAVTREQLALTEQLLAAVGEVGWIDDESLMDAVTAVSGSGPAYVFLLAETLAQAGIEAGLPAELAQRLARATVAGAGELLHRSNDTPARLRENVTSPAGTTASALSVLMAPDGLQPLMTRAVAAATKRGKELAG